MTDPSPLLTIGDPPAFQVFPGTVDCPYLFTADHAGRLLPRSLGNLGLTESELCTHIAWDIGIQGVGERLAAGLGAFLITQTYSRLVIDCNRPLDVDSSIAAISENTVIEGNRQLTVVQVRARQQAVFLPYHARIEAELERRERAQLRTVVVALHSFTPRYKGVSRPWHCGVLYNRDPRLARAIYPLLEREGFTVGDNQPYSVSDESDYGIPRYGEQRGLLHLEFEIRQDLIADADGQSRWANLLARLLPEADRAVPRA
jgi:predicted N-formylglutamate amidohydrolase